MTNASVSTHQPDEVPCNICGGLDFVPGPAGRMATNGRRPCCRQCGALERQRIVRRILQAAPVGFLSWRRGLQFSADPSISPGWFRHYEISTYGGENSLDIQNIARDAGSYDFISFSHVIEFVQNDLAAFAEMVRVLSPQGMIQACFSAPQLRERSEDYATPSGPHQAWHLYGMDVTARFAGLESQLVALVVEETDPCTNIRELVHLFFKRPSDSMRMRSWLSALNLSAVSLP